jgi:hypothetical protein
MTHGAVGCRSLPTPVSSVRRGLVLVWTCIVRTPSCDVAPCSSTKSFFSLAGLLRGLCVCGNRVPGKRNRANYMRMVQLAGGGMTAPVRVKLSLASFGRGLGLEWSVLARGRPQAVLFGSRLALVSGASATQSPHPSTTRRGRQLSSVNRLHQPCSTFALLTKPSLPTTIHSTLPLAPTSSFSGTRTLELSFRLASSPVLLHATSLQFLVSTFHPDLATAAPAIHCTSVQVPVLIYPKFDSLAESHCPSHG